MLAELKKKKPKRKAFHTQELILDEINKFRYIYGCHALNRLLKDVFQVTLLIVEVNSKEMLAVVK